VPPISRTVPGFEAIDYYGIVAPKGLSPEIRRKLNFAIIQTVKSKDVQEKLRAFGNIPFSSTPEYFRDFIKSEVNTWFTLITEVGITSD